MGESDHDKVLIGVICGVVGFIILKSACLFYVCYWRKRKSLKGRWQPPHSKRGHSYVKADGSLEDWELDLSNVQICTTEEGQLWELGHGGFGRVYKGVRAEVQPVAVKMVAQSADRKAHESFVHEISMLKFVSRDRNIVQFYGAGIRNQQLWLVTEFMEGGDLRQALSTEMPHRVTWWNGGKPIAMDVARGLAFLHANKVIHRDLKSKNILLTAEGQAKIGDVGMAKIMSEGYFSHDEAFGTFAWAAPELLLNDRCTDKVDIYSLGVVIWEIVTGELPIRGSIIAPEVPRQCPPEVAQIVQECMRREPSARPTPGEVFRRLAMCPPNPRKTPILDSAEEQMGLANQLAANDKQLMDLMQTMSHDGDSTSKSGRSPGDSVISMGVDNYGQPRYTRDTSDSSGISGIIPEEGPEVNQPGYSYMVPRPHADSAAPAPATPPQHAPAANGHHSPSPPSPALTAGGSGSARPSTDIQSTNQDASTTNSRYSSSNVSDSINTRSVMGGHAFSLSPNGDVVVEIDGLPRRLPVDGAVILRQQQALLQQQLKEQQAAQAAAAGRGGAPGGGAAGGTGVEAGGISKAAKTRGWLRR